MRGHGMVDMQSECVTPGTATWIGNGWGGATDVID